MNLKTLYQNLKTVLRDAGIQNFEQGARRIVAKRFGFSLTDITMRGDEDVGAGDAALCMADAAACGEGMPLSKLYGETEFWGLPFSVNQHVLDPRPETELIIELALQRFPKDAPLDILDIGTGSGCIILSLLSEFPNARGVAIDISQEALSVARENAKNLNLDSRVNFIHGEWTRPVNQKFDLVVSNPPYIESKVIPNLEKNVRNHDPILALDGGEDGLQAYKEIFSDLFRILKTDGLGLFEIGFDQKESVVKIAEGIAGKSRIRVKSVHVDYAGNQRVVEADLNYSGGDK